MKREGPAWQLLAGVPFALPVVQQAALGETLLQAAHQILAIAPLGWTNRIDVPFPAVHVVDRNERRLATHAQAHIIFLQVQIHPVTERLDGLPLLIRIRLGVARILSHTCNRHLEIELHLALFVLAADGRGVGR